MKQDALSSVNAASMFSVNTSLNTVQNLNNYNYLHTFYQQLFPDNNTYPFLSKLLFLHFILRENVLIYSSRRAEIKEVWTQVGKQLSAVLPVFIIDSLSKMDQILKIMGERKKALIFDLSSISNQGLNYLLNNPLVEMSWVVVESKDKPLRPELSDLFPLIFHDDEEQKYQDLLAQKPEINKKIVQKFNKDKFNEVVAFNFNQTIQSKQQEGFLKTYLQILREKIAAHTITVPVSRWKKMLQILHFVGLTKQQGTFRRLSLSDCLLTPQCLGRTYQQLQSICRCNEETLLQIIPYFGTSKWSKQLATHFWIQSKQKQYFLSLTDKLKGKVSFFYPCSKFPQSVRLLSENGLAYYRVGGHDKKLMSDKYLDVHSAQKYRLNLKYRSSYPVLMHFGVACYDQNRTLISPVQACRYEETAVRLQGLLANKLVIVQEDRHLLQQWKPSNSFAYERCIGIYSDGSLNRILPISEISYANTDSYSQQPSAGVYCSISEDGIELTEAGLKTFRQLQNIIVPGTTKLVNHYEGGTYAINQTHVGLQQQWKTIEANYFDFQRNNSGTNFLLGTKSVRIVVMVNYNSGYPNFKIQNPAAEVDFKQIEWQVGE